jgi:hypothetical protein
MSNSVEVPAQIPTPMILINLAQQARKAESDKVLQFLLVNHMILANTSMN